jgi:hypothetical protein
MIFDRRTGSDWKKTNDSYFYPSRRETSANVLTVEGPRVAVPVGFIDGALLIT